MPTLFPYTTLFRSWQPTALPLAWYWTIPAPCRLYDCHPDQLYYALDVRQVKASVVIAKHRLPREAQKGPAPNVCIVLHDYRSLDWVHADGEAVAVISGDHMAFVVDGESFTPLPLELKEPIPIARCDLVILDDAKEEMEAAAVSRPRCGNTAEQRATALVIAALATGAYPGDVAHPYRMASKVCAAIELAGHALSRETVAQKLKAALAP